MQLVWPAAQYVHSFVDALQRGYSPDHMRGAAATAEILAKIAADPAAFLAQQVDREAKGAPIPLPDGTLGRRLPGYIRWLWDGEFCGSLGFRWQPGTGALPPHVLGHIGYSVVEAKRRRGYAIAALAQQLIDCRAEGLPYVELTTDPENIASQEVIRKNGGVVVERFSKPPMYGGGESLRWRISL